MAKIECSNRLRVILAEKEITNRWLEGAAIYGSVCRNRPTAQSGY